VLASILLLSFGSSLSAQDLGPVPGQPVGGPSATAEHDIAPWDGPAFGLWIPAEKFGGKPDSWIYLRIWDAPEKSQKKFVFPDRSMKVGAVVYFLDLKSPRSLDWKSQPRKEVKGWVRFIRADRRQAIVGEFDFVSEEAISLKGQFEAEWINKGLLEQAEQGVSTGRPKDPEQNSPAAGSKTTGLYLIEGQPASKQAFNTVLKSLKQTSNVYCERTLYGGNTGFDAVDGEGQAYVYREEMTKEGAIHSITKGSWLKNAEQSNAADSR